MNKQGILEPPAGQAIWFNERALPGQPGIAVLAGHVTYNTPDVFYHLKEVPLNSGVKATVKCRNGVQIQLVVADGWSGNRTQLADDPRIWGGSSTPVVIVMTCDIDTKAGHQYDNNWVLRLLPI